MCNALLILARYAAIGHAYAVDFGSPRADVKAALRAVNDQPVPFPDVFASDETGTRPLTLREWIRLQHDPAMALFGEFPWESSTDNPGNQAITLLRGLLPQPAEGTLDG